MTDLESLIDKFYKAKQAWIDADEKASLLEEDRKPYLSNLMNANKENDISEAKRERIAQGSDEYRQYIRGMVMARTEANRHWALYEARKATWESKRSEMAREREQINARIFEQGGK